MTDIVLVLGTNPLSHIPSKTDSRIWPLTVGRNDVIRLDELLFSCVFQSTKISNIYITITFDRSPNEFPKLGPCQTHKEIEFHSTSKVRKSNVHHKHHERFE